LYAPIPAAGGKKFIWVLATADLTAPTSAPGCRRDPPESLESIAKYPSGLSIG